MKEENKIDFVKEFGDMTFSKAEVFRKKFKEEKGINWLNSQGEPDIEYVDWLEHQLRDRNEYARIHIEKDRERVKAEIRTNAKTEGMALTVVKMFDIITAIPIKLD